MKNNVLAIFPVIVALLALSVATSWPTHAQAQTKRYTDEAEYCKGTLPNGDPNPCAALVYADGTTNYYVNSVTVEARGQANQQWDVNQNCLNFKTNNTMDIRAAEYGVFVLPAPCSYKLTIKIGAGDTKSQHVFLSPGCELVLESTGTTLNDNTPKVDKVVWTDQASQALQAKGITVSKADVSDRYYHAARQEQKVHYCNKDENAGKNFN